jgi:hypothetical protein
MCAVLGDVPSGGLSGDCCEPVPVQYACTMVLYSALLACLLPVCLYASSRRGSLDCQCNAGVLLIGGAGMVAAGCCLVLQSVL